MMATADFQSNFVVRNFLASLRGEVTDPFESMRTGFQMLNILPASRRAVLDHLATILLHPRREFQINREQERLLMLIIDEISLKDWCHILGDWCCHVLARSRFESHNTAFIEKLLVNCYKAGLEVKGQLDWLQPTLFSVPFSSRNIFSDLLRRFVANFSQHFLSGLIRFALGMYKQQGQLSPNNMFALGHTLDHLGHGFPGELQQIVDELLSTDQHSIQLLMDISQAYPQIQAIIQLRIARRLSLGSDMRDLSQIFQAVPETQPKLQLAKPNLLKRALLSKPAACSHSWSQLFCAVVGAYCQSQHYQVTSLSSQMFAKLFLEELTGVLTTEQLKQLIAGSISREDSYAILEHTLTASANRSLDFKALSTLTIVCLMNSARPGCILAEMLFEPKMNFRHDSTIEFTALYAIMVALETRSALGSVIDQFVQRLIDLISTEPRHKVTPRLWTLKELLKVERQQTAMEATCAKAFSLIAELGQHLGDLWRLLCDQFHPDLVAFLAELVHMVHPRTWTNLEVKSPFVSDRIGLSLVLELAEMIKANDPSATQLQLYEKRLQFEKLLYLLYIFVNFWLPRPNISTDNAEGFTMHQSALLLLDAFLRQCFDCATTKFASDKLNQAFFVLAIKMLLCPINGSNMKLTVPPKYDQGSLWRLPLGPPEPNSIVFMARLLLQLLSPDIIHAVASAPLDWPLDLAIESGNPPVPVDYREYCLKIRNLVTLTCPYLLDFLSFFICLTQSSNYFQTSSSQNHPIVILLPIFRALLYASLCCVQASAKLPSLSEVNQKFITRVLTLLQQARLVQPPFCHLPSLLHKLDPNQLSIIFRTSWPLLINTKQFQGPQSSPASPVSPSSPAQSGSVMQNPHVAPVLTVLKSKLNEFACVLPIFEAEAQLII